VLVLAAAGAAAGSIFDAVESFGFEDPGSEGARANERVEEATGAAATPGVLVLVEHGGDVKGPEGRAAIRAAVDRLADVPGIAEVRGPSELGPTAISTDGDAAYVAGYLAADESDPTEVGERAVDAFKADPVTTIGGPAVASYELGVQSEEDLRHAELIAAPILILLCFWVFRSLIAALLPLVVGAFAIVATLGVLRAMTEVVEIDVFTINAVTGLGLGLAIDYSLLIVARYREELARQGHGWEAVHRTLDTAGRTVVFSAVTVCFALAALLVFPQRFLYSIAIGGALVVILSAVAGLTLLPAILSALGERVNALAPPRLQRHAGEASETSGGWYRLAAFVMRRPAPVAVGAAVVLIAAGIPFLQVDLTTPDARILGEEHGARRVDDQLRERFAGPATTPFVAVIDEAPAANSSAAVEPVADEIRDLPHVAEVSGPTSLGANALQLSVIADVDALSNRGQSLLREIRSLEWPFPTLVGGRTAELVDQKQSLESHLPIAIAIIAVLTLVTLWVMTGSVVLPFAALLMNFLTISAAFGVVVFVFQDGRLEALLAYTSQHALDVSMPILLFAVAFGLSTDYGVFLLSRIKEARDAGADDTDAVAIGLERTGRIVTAAALLFSVALGVFITSELVYVKEFALGLVTAVLVDATIVRALLLPAIMRLLGRAAWWAPRPIARIHQRLGAGAT
jgi:uncharacterized membrane protein YdfJ with MMPL/SSD domain